MKYPHLIVALLALAFATPAAIAQTGTSPTAANAEPELKKIEQEMLDGVLKHDAAPAKKYLADTFVFIAPDGETSTKAAFVGDMTGALKMDSSTYSEMKVQSYGNSAVVTYRSNDKGTYKGHDITGEYRWTDFFVNKDGAWQVVASQGTALAKK